MTATFVEVDGAPARVVHPYDSTDADIRTAYLVGHADGHRAGHGDGYHAGFAAGWAASDAEMARLQRHAVEVVHALATAPERDRAADRARRERIDARWPTQEVA